MLLYCTLEDDDQNMIVVFDSIYFRFVNPLVFGDYPGIVKKNAGKRIPAFTKAESKYLKGSIDFLGVNHYATTYIKDRSSSLNEDNRDVIADMAVEISCMLHI